MLKVKTICKSRLTWNTASRNNVYVAVMMIAACSAGVCQGMSASCRINFTCRIPCREFLRIARFRSGLNTSESIMICVHRQVVKQNMITTQNCRPGTGMKNLQSPVQCRCLHQCVNCAEKRVSERCFNLCTSPIFMTCVCVPVVTFAMKRYRLRYYGCNLRCWVSFLERRIIYILLLLLYIAYMQYIACIHMLSMLMILFVGLSFS